MNNFQVLRILHDLYRAHTRPIPGPSGHLRNRPSDQCRSFTIVIALISASQRHHSRHPPIIRSDRRPLPATSHAHPRHPGPTWPEYSDYHPEYSDYHCIPRITQITSGGGANSRKSECADLSLALSIRESFISEGPSPHHDRQNNPNYPDYSSDTDYTKYTKHRPHYSREMPATSAKTVNTPDTPNSSITPESAIDRILALVADIDVILTKPARGGLTTADKLQLSKYAKEIGRKARFLKQNNNDPDITIVNTDLKESILSAVRNELAEFREEFNNSAPKSYAAAAAANSPKKPKSANKVAIPVSRPAIIISSENAEKTGKEILKDWRENVSFKDTKFAPAKVQLVSNNKVRVEFGSESECAEVLGKVEQTGVLRAERSRRRNPLVIFKGVSNDIPSKELRDIILSQNPSLHHSNDIKFRFARNNRNPDLYNAVFEVTPKSRIELLELLRVNIDHFRVRVEDFFPFTQCFKCLQFGHTSSTCTAKSPNCSNCSKSGHGYRECPEDAELCCLNCSIDNEKYKRHCDVKHSATSQKYCPKIKAMLKILKQRTDFGYSEN